VQINKKEGRIKRLVTEHQELATVDKEKNHKDEEEKQ
jgi:hypothetical protein